VYRRYGEKRILTPTPTELPQRVKATLARETTNPNLDPQLFRERGCRMARRLAGARDGKVYIWAGKVILGLETAVANAVKPGTKVLVIDNGVYGSVSPT